MITVYVSCVRMISMHWSPVARPHPLAASSVVNDPALSVAQQWEAVEGGWPHETNDTWAQSSQGPINSP